MTGLPTSMALELEDGSGNFTNDITGYMRNRAYTLSRGWSDENDEDNVQPAKLDFELDNKSGEFTLGAANFNGITKDKRARLSVTVGATTYRRCVGYAVDWPTKWQSALSNMAIASVTVMDRFARLNRRKLRSMTENEVVADGAVAYYTLAEPAGSASAGDTSGAGRRPLTFGGDPASSPVVFGATSPNAWDGLTAAQFAGGQYLKSGFDGLVNVPLTISLFFNVATPPAGTPRGIVTIDTAIGTVDVGVWTTGELTLYGGPVGGPNVCDGSWHHLALALGNATATVLYLDGAVLATFGVDSNQITSAINIGGPSTRPGSTTTTLQGSLSHVAVFGTRLTAGQIANLSNAGLIGFATDRADQRIARLAGYANIAVGDQNLETGQQPSIAVQATDGVSALDAMREVAQAEGGALFIAGDGTLTEHNKGHRVLKATSAPAATFTADQVDWRDAEFESLNYLFNTATGTRDGGAQQRSVNTTSRGKYEEWSTDRSRALLPTDELLLNQLTWITTMYGEPLARLASFSLDLLTLPQATVQAALALELGDHIRITGFPAQAPASSIDLILEGFKETASQTKDQTVWKITFNTAPAQLFYAWILGDATYGVLGSTTRLYF